MSSSVLILGARGRFGLATARAFADAGWQVLAQVRAGAQLPTNGATDSRIRWLQLDLTDVQALTTAARSATVVVHALNPAYTNKAWRAQAVSLLENTIQIARLLKATVMFPGNVYNFGTDMPSVLREDTPHLANTVMGQIRMQMETQLLCSGVPSVVIRAGNFFGSGQGSWFDMALVKNIHKGLVTYPGAGDIPLAWAYLPDLARTFVAVADRRTQLQPFEVFHFAGHHLTLQNWLEALEPLAHQQGWVKRDAHLKLRGMPWLVIRLGALVIPAWSTLLDMRYLFDTPHALANDKLTALIAQEPHTPLAQAVRDSLADLRML